MQNPPAPPSSASVWRRFGEAAQGILALLGIMTTLGAGAGLYFAVRADSKVLTVKLDNLARQVQEMRASRVVDRLTSVEKDVEHLQRSEEAAAQHLREVQRTLSELQRTRRR